MQGTTLLKLWMQVEQYCLLLAPVSEAQYNPPAGGVDSSTTPGPPTGIESQQHRDNLLQSF